MPKENRSWGGKDPWTQVVAARGPGSRIFLERSISAAYPELDTDLARDNLENDLPAADLEDL